MTDININYNGFWVEVGPDTDSLTWARTTVAERWADEDRPPDPQAAEAIAENMAGIIDTAFALDSPPSMLFLLYPMADIPVLAAVAVRTAPCGGKVSLDRLAEDLRLPDSMLEQPIDQSIVATPAGPAMRLVQRFRASGEPGIEQVQEFIAYAWIIDDGEDTYCVTVSTSFTDLVNAGEWLPAVDELARSLEVIP